MKKYALLLLATLGIISCIYTAEADAPQNKQKILETFLVENFPIPQSFKEDDVNKEIDFPGCGKFRIEKVTKENTFYKDGVAMRVAHAEVSFIQPVQWCGLNVANYKMFYRYEATESSTECKIVSPERFMNWWTVGGVAFAIPLGLIAIGAAIEAAVEIKNMFKK
ncbi:MAG: hypothetical protein WCE21_02880 [Candidatus Babeliales bacterium]